LILAAGCARVGFAPWPGDNPASGDAASPFHDAGSSDATHPLYDVFADPFDIDNDGVPNALDNCPTVPNTDQGNEDGDRFGDACDPCPPIADDAPSDSDQDGVADACDPHPAVPGDLIVLFEGFHGGLPGGWATTGTWAQAGDDIETSGSGIETLITPIPTAVNQTISARFTVISTGGGIKAAAVADSFDPTTDVGITCGPGQGTGTPSTPTLAIVDLATMTQVAYTDYVFTAGTEYMLSLERADTTYTCTATQPSAATVTDSPSRSGLSTGVGIRTRNASVRFQWLLIVQN